MTGIFQDKPLTRRSFLTKSALAAGTTLSAGSILAACGASSPATSSASSPVVLKFFHWIGGDAGPVITEINKRFHAENPNITVQFSTLPTDQYETVLKARLVGGDAPDVFGVFPGTKIYPYAKAGYLVDLSNESWVSRLQTGAKSVVTYNSKIYALPMDENVIGVIYNKQLFKDHGLSIPQSWTDFLNVCQKLKAAGITPLALGNKDLWVDQLIPYAMAPSAIYRDTPDFDQQLFGGKGTFATSPWTQMMKDYLDLNKKGYFNAGVLGTTYDQTSQLMAAGKAAMVVNGNWMLVPIEANNPAIQMGMFPLPYVQAGQPIWISASVGATSAISASTKYAAEAKKYLQFWARADIMSIYLQQKKAYSALTDVSNPALDPAALEMQTPLKVGSYNFLDQKWPNGPQDVMQKDIQGVFAGSTTIEQMLQDMDKSFQANKASVS